MDNDLTSPDKGHGSVEFEVVDLGAGLLSLLGELSPLLSEACQSLSNVTIRYTAYEANPSLQEPIRDRLRVLGFVSNEVNGDWEGQLDGLSFSVHLLQQDFMTCPLFGERAVQVWERNS